MTFGTVVWLVLGVLIAYLFGAALVRLFNPAADVLCTGAQTADRHVERARHTTRNWMDTQIERHGLSIPSYARTAVVFLLVCLGMLGDFLLMKVTFDSLFPSVTTPFFPIKVSTILAAFAVILPFLFALVAENFFSNERLAPDPQYEGFARQRLWGWICILLLCVAIALQVAAAWWRADQVKIVYGLTGSLPNWVFGLMALLGGAVAALAGQYLDKFMAGLSVGATAVGVYAPLSVAHGALYVVHELTETSRRMVTRAIGAVREPAHLLLRHTAPNFDEEIEQDWHEALQEPCPCKDDRLTSPRASHRKELPVRSNRRLQSPGHRQELGHDEQTRTD